VEPCFHEDSYGYRPGKSALDAIGVARQRCWRYAWVLDLDIQSLFDRIDSKLLMRAVRKHTDCPWVLLYIERWLQAPVRSLTGAFCMGAAEQWEPDEARASRPVLRARGVKLRRATHLICHCKSADEARALWSALADRLAACKLILHPEKTKIVYCKDANRRGDYPTRLCRSPQHDPPAYRAGLRRALDPGKPAPPPWKAGLLRDGKGMLATAKALGCGTSCRGKFRLIALSRT
jgi:hypothetical protein